MSSSSGGYNYGDEYFSAASVSYDEDMELKCKDEEYEEETK